LRARLLALLVALSAAAPLTAQQDQRVVRGLSFEGNHAIDDYTLSAAIATSNSSFFASVWWLRWTHLGEKRYLNEVEYRRDVLRLLLLYRRSGYVNVVIDTVVHRTDRNVFITIRIHEGDPVRLERLDVVGADSIFNVARLKKDLPLQVGSPFSRFLFQASADTIVGRLKNAGHPYAQVLRNFDEDHAALRAGATLEVVPGPRMRIGEVAIRGLGRVDTGTVRSMLSVKPQDVFRQDKLYQSQRDLYDLGVFRSVNVVLADSLAPAAPGDTLVRAVVRLAEGANHRVFAGAGYGTIDCFRLQGGWTAYNFFGGARALDITGSVSKLGVGVPLDAGLRNNVCQSLRADSTSDTLNYTVGFTLRQPTFFSPRHTARLSVFAERRSEFKTYTRQDVGLNPALTINARRNIPVTVGYRYSVGRTTADAAVYCSVFRVCDEMDRSLLASSRRFAAVTVSGVRSRVNSVLDPTNGGLVTVGLMHASRFVGSDTLYEFNRGELEVSRYYPLGRRAVFAWRVRGGTILPARRITLSGQSARFVPPDQRFYGGGPNSVRGYARNGLGPRVYVTDGIVVTGTDSTFLNVRAAATGGNATFVLNSELRFATPLFPERMRVALFVDVGQVWERGDQLIAVHGVRVTPGAGLRFVTPLGPVRIDAAYNGYAAEPGPLYFQNNTDASLTLIPNVTYQPGRATAFGRRVVVQFAVGQAF
jgi:outer membrane protein insertion porin family